MKDSSRHLAVLMAAITVTMTFTSHEALGQRTMDGQLMAGASASSSCYRLADTGVRLHCGRYVMSGCWEAWLGAYPWSIRTASGGRMTYGHLAAGAEYLFRLISNRRRSLCLYAGGGALLGVEGYDMWRRLPSYIETDFPKGRFLYGICASLELEVFLTGRAAAVLSGSLPYTISSLMRPFHPQLMLGLRVAL